MELELRSDWTSERYAEIVGDLEAISPADNTEEVVLVWHGPQPSLWQLAWIAECVRQLRAKKMTWRWRSSGERFAPACLRAGGLLHAGGLPRHI